jgi:hypothetical protein
MNGRSIAFLAGFGLLVGFAAPAFADDVADMRAELEAMKRKMEAQERKMREMEGTALTREEITASLGKYLDASPVPAVLVGGGGADGSAGFPLGKKPFIKEGPNKLEIGLRFQVRYSAFLYSDDAGGVTLGQADADAAEETIVTDGTPRDRSGFELERMYVSFDGAVFCPEITFKLELNFDTDSGTGLEKNYAYLDWKYSGEHHVRAGSDKVPYSVEENHSSSVIAFVDRSIVTKAFEVGFSTGIAAWGYFGDCECPKRFMYKVQAGNGEGRQNQEGGTAQGSPFNRDARDTYSDQLLLAAMFEWNLSPGCKEFKWDEVDHRPCDKRCELLMALGVGGYYENDDDSQHAAWGGLRLGSGSDRADRYGLDAWFRLHYNGWSVMAEYILRNIDYQVTAAGVDSTNPVQEDSGAQLLVHYRFPDNNWGVGARAGIIWLDDDYLTVGVDSPGPVEVEDTITEFGVVVNYFFWDHNHKLQADVNWVQDNSGVNSSSAGYMNGVANRGVVVEDGLYLRIQWQLNL